MSFVVKDNQKTTTKKKRHFVKDKTLKDKTLKDKTLCITGILAQ